MHNSKLHNFYFVKPMPNMDADTLSEKLLSVEGIEKVYVTEGDYGFLARVKYTNGKADFGSYIAENMNNMYDYTLRYYGFKKK